MPVTSLIECAFGLRVSCPAEPAPRRRVWPLNLLFTKKCSNIKIQCLTTECLLIIMIRTRGERIDGI